MRLVSDHSDIIANVSPLKALTITLFLFLGLSAGVLVNSFKDQRWTGGGWLALSLVLLTLAFIAAKNQVYR